MGIPIDSFLAGRGEAATTSSAPSVAAESRASGTSRAEREAYASMFTKAPTAQIHDPRWIVTHALDESERVMGRMVTFLMSAYMSLLHNIDYGINSCYPKMDYLVSGSAAKSPIGFTSRLFCLAPACLTPQLQRAGSLAQQISPPSSDCPGSAS